MPFLTTARGIRVHRRVYNAIRLNRFETHSNTKTEAMSNPGRPGSCRAAFLADNSPWSESMLEHYKRISIAIVQDHTLL